MTTDGLADALALKVICGEMPGEFSGVYVGDLLSRTMSHVREGDLWITIMSNINVVAVASLTDCAAVIFAEGVIPAKDALDAAREKGINLISCDMPAYEICARIAKFGGTK